MNKNVKLIVYTVFENVIYFNIIHIFTATFDQFNVSLLKKINLR